jgi:hypothetical protein
MTPEFWLGVACVVGALLSAAMTVLFVVGGLSMVGEMRRDRERRSTTGAWAPPRDAGDDDYIPATIVTAIISSDSSDSSDCGGSDGGSSCGSD